MGVMQRIFKSLRGILLGQFLIGIFISGLIGLPGTTPAVEPLSKEKELVMAGDDYGFPSPYTFVPRGPGYTRVSLLFDTLVWQDEQGTVPYLAERWESSPDGRVWTFHLNRKATFHDGRSVTSQDVVFSFEILKKHPHPWYAGSIEEVERVIAEGDFTVLIHLRRPFAPFLTNIAGNVLILPKHIWESVDDPGKFNSPSAVVGSGPFKLVEYSKEKGTYIYAVNPDHFMGKPVVDRLVMIPGGELVMKLNKGEADTGSPKIQELPPLEKNPKLKVISQPGFWVMRIYFNMTGNPLLQEKRLREAMILAINRTELTERTQQKGAVPGKAGYAPAETWWYSPVREYPFDLDKANALLDDLGFTQRDEKGIRMDGEGRLLKFELLCGPDTARDAELTKQYLKAVGIGIQVKGVDGRSLDALMLDNKFDMAINGHGGLGGDPVHLLRAFSLNVKGGPAKTSGGMRNDWVHPEFNRLAPQLMVTMDEKQRLGMAQRLQEIIADEVPTIALYYRNVFFAYNTDKLNGWFFTKGGIAGGIPTEMNKLVFLRGQWGQGEEQPAASTPEQKSMPALNGNLWPVGLMVGVITGGLWYWKRRKRNA